MSIDSEKRHRRTTRLKDYDYAQAGAYFITICTKDRACLFGEIVDGEMRLNQSGRMVETVWEEIPCFYPGIDIDTFIVMPNHVHGIILVGAAPRGRPDSWQPQGVAPTLSLPDVVHRFKTLTTKRYVNGVKQSGWTKFPGRVWQRNYFDHIIRSEEYLNRIREYIIANPQQWASDRENPQAGINDHDDIRLIRHKLIVHE
jgi:REP element-mobilizing transposase RayT